MKKFLALLLTIVMTVSMTVCVGSAETSDEQIVLEYWSSWSETENQALVLKAAAESFMEKHPNVKINFTFNGRDNRKLVVSAIEAGTQIDLMDANIDNVQKLWSENIKDLSEYMTKTYDTTDGKPYNECVIPSMVQLASDLFDGKTMCVPYIPQAFMIFCNKNIFEEVGITEYPTTWDEFLADCEKIKAAGYTPITTDSNYATSWVGYYLSRLIGTDRVAELVYDSAAFKSEPAVLEAAKAIEEMAQKGYFDANIASNVYPVAQQDMVISENIAMYINGTWLPNEVSSTTSDTYKWGAFAFPEVPNGVEGTEAGCYSTYAIAINKDCDDATTEAAFEFIVYITTGEVDQTFCDQANAIPMSVTASWPENLADAQVALNAYTKRYPSQTALIVNSDSKTIIAEACLKLMAGTITAEEFVEEAGSF
ncbi:MAG: ABC transporter substrate-binding protein [Clostridia bacterium]|nr:ABC transporter substrate-binding protein [Clostridia bacterium]